MRIKNKTIALRHLLSVLIGWLHCTLIFSPLYALLINQVFADMTRGQIAASHVKGLLFIVPIILSWFARRYIKNIFLYVLASAAIVTATIFLFHSGVMAVPAVFVCFIRLYGRLMGDDHSLFDHAGYPALTLFLIPLLASFFIQRLNGVYQPLALLYAGIYFLLCFTQRGIDRIDSYIDVNRDMHNMPSRRIVHISAAILTAAAVIFAVILLPPLLSNDAEYKYTPPPASSTEHGVQQETSSEAPPQDQEDWTDVDVESNPVLEWLFKIVELLLVVIVGVGTPIAIVYGILRLSRAFRKSFQDRGDFVENLQDDKLEAIRERREKRGRPGLFDRSPNAVIRRRYRKTVLRAAKTAPQPWMSPSEVERHAGLTAAETLHTVYEKARYSPDGCTKDDLSAV